MKKPTKAQLEAHNSNPCSTGRCNICQWRKKHPITQSPSPTISPTLSCSQANFDEDYYMDEYYHRQILIRKILYWMLFASLILLSWIAVYQLAEKYKIQSPVSIKFRPVIIKRYKDTEKKSKPRKSQIKAKDLKPIVENGKVKLVGTASHYNRAGCLGCDPNFIMANGKPLIDENFTLAMTPEIVKKYKLMNKNVLIRNIKTGKEVVATVTDTGGFGKLNRIADLTDATRDGLGCSGLCEVEIYL